jgi:hypothetical protein
MVRVQLCKATSTNPDEAEVLAEVVVQDREVDVSGPRADLVDLSQRVMSIKQQRSIAFSDDPEEWARSLVGSFRMPDLYAQVVDDDDPPAPAAASEPIELEEPKPKPKPTFAVTRDRERAPV